MGYVVGENDEHCTEKAHKSFERIYFISKNLTRTISVILKDVKHYKPHSSIKELKRKSVNGKRLYENQGSSPQCYYYLPRQNKIKTKASLLIGKNVLVKKKHNAL